MSTRIKFETSTQLKKVTQLFFKKGYYATSMQDIVTTTGLNRSSIYNTFGSKLAFFIQCFEKCESNYRKEVQKIILSGANPIKSIIDIFELSIESTINGYLLPNYVSELKNEEPAIRKLVINQHEYLLDLFINIVKKGQDLGAINNSKSSKQYAIYLLNSYQGLKILNHISKDKNDLKNIIFNTMLILE